MMSLVLNNQALYYNFSYLFQDLSGSSLYVLYRAIKLHVEKGPVDCLTGDARYTLSEDKLLRDKIDPKLLVGGAVYYHGECIHIFGCCFCHFYKGKQLFCKVS